MKNDRTNSTNSMDSAFTDDDPGLLGYDRISVEALEAVGTGNTDNSRMRLIPCRHCIYDYPAMDVAMTDTPTEEIER